MHALLEAAGATEPQLISDAGSQPRSDVYLKPSASSAATAVEAFETKRWPQGKVPGGKG
jgi:hypothetical protein